MRKGESHFVSPYLPYTTSPKILSRTHRQAHTHSYTHIYTCTHTLVGVRACMHTHTEDTYAYAFQGLDYQHFFSASLDPWVPGVLAKHEVHKRTVTQSCTMDLPSVVSTYLWAKWSVSQQPSQDSPISSNSTALETK